MDRRERDVKENKIRHEHDKTNRGTRQKERKYSVGK